MSTPGQQVYNGRYELHRKIARGGMADVFLARDSLLNRPVALKVLFPEFATDPAFVERFRREAQSAANLSNPHIVSIYDWGEHEGTYFIVMEYVEGRSLAQILRDEGPFHPDRAADVAADIAAALAFAHRNGVVHRDVKPGNVLITPNGQVKVTDFGIARAVSSQDNLTQTGTVMGTATYFSPEQARGESVDPRSDVYSLGIVLYEMLAGRPPFSGDNPVSVAYKHVQEAPDPVTRRNPDVPAPLAAVVHKAIAKELADRYPSAEDLRQDLRRFRAGQPVQAAGLADATTALGATAAMAATTAVPATRRNAAYEGFDTTRAAPGMLPGSYDEEPPPRRNRTFAIVLGVLVVALLVALFFLARSLGIGGSGDTVEVPGVLDLPQAEAISELEEAGFVVDVDPQPNDQVEPGIVFDQDPAGGTQLEEGRTVRLTVSGGPQDVEVPDVVGQPEADAVADLQAADLTPDVVQEPNDTVPAGEVVSQLPVGGSSASPGSTVRIVVSSGAESLVLPDVSGTTVEEAQARLARDGLQTTVSEEASTDVPEGRVIRTDPGAGAEVTRQQSVTLVVSTGADTATVPNVIGRPPEEAAQILRSDGFTVERSTQAVSNPNDVGRVVGQQPSAGSEQPSGTTVTIVVGQQSRPTTSTTSSTTSSTSTTSTTEAGLGDGDELPD